MKIGNFDYGSPAHLPEIMPVFPLPAALLLPRADMPLNIFEPRYMAMVDWALAGDRVIGMIQPGDGDGPCEAGVGLCGIGCAGRITSFAETGDGRYLITLTGIARFHVTEEIASDSAFRLCRISAAAFADDFTSADEGSVDRDAVLRTFRDYLRANSLETDWDSVHSASNEILVNAMSMMAPFGAAEKQALLEAPDLRTRAETLVAITELLLAREAGDERALQ
ncbi:MAG: LON peptidase substrate-binding domain-containing protein [Alphaproteobacteria bacterium]